MTSHNTCHFMRPEAHSDSMPYSHTSALRDGGRGGGTHFADKEAEAGRASSTASKGQNGV